MHLNCLLFFLTVHSVRVLNFRTIVLYFQLGVTNDDHDENSKTAYEAFVKDLRERTNGFKDCRYAVFDFKFSCNRPGAGTSKMDKIVFIQVGYLLRCAVFCNFLSKVSRFRFFSFTRSAYQFRNYLRIVIIGP